MPEFFDLMGQAAVLIQNGLQAAGNELDIRRKSLAQMQGFTYH